MPRLAGNEAVPQAGAAAQEIARYRLYVPGGSHHRGPPSGHMSATNGPGLGWCDAGQAGDHAFGQGLLGTGLTVALE